MHARLQHIVTGSVFAGLEIEFLDKGIAFHLILLKRKGEQLLVEKTVSTIESIEKISGYLTKDIPLAIAFTGKGILHRRISVDPDSDPKILLSKVLPNASLKEFYLQVVPASQDQQFVSILRKSTVDELLDQLKQFSVVECSFGPLAVINILPLFDEPKTELWFGHHIIYLQNSKIEEVNYSEVNSEKITFDLGGQKVEEENLLAFASAFQQLLVQEQKAGVQVESLISVKQDFLQHKLFKTTGKSFLIMTFLILTGNYFVFSHYWSEKSQLENKLQTDGGAFTDLRKLEKQVQAKRTFLEQAGLLHQTNNSYYADQIAFDLPEEILLTRLVLAPRLKIAQEDSIGFKPGLVEIDGSCSQSIILNKWLRELKEKKWVRSVALESYIQDKNMNQGEFQISLELQ